MSARIDIPASERGKTRVFAVNLPWAEAQATTAQALLGVEDLPEGAATLFPVADLADIGLTGYLTEGLGLSDDQIAVDKSKLSALDGFVLVLVSNLLKGQAVTVDPGPNLTLIGTYLDVPAAVDLTPLTSDAASGQLAGGNAPLDPPKFEVLYLMIAAIILSALVLAIFLVGLL